MKSFQMVARIVTNSPPSLDGSRNALFKLFRSLPNATRIGFLVTPGGYCPIQIKRRWAGRSGWGKDDDELKPILRDIEPQLRWITSDKMTRLARNKVLFITLGVDVYYEDSRNPRAELVLVFDISKGKLRGWTGKSFPTQAQEHHLVQISDLSSHCFNLNNERVLVLGCHDLNMFNPRGKANRSRGSHRDARCNEMARVLKRFKPTVVLHHPHTTDSSRTWLLGWSGLRDQYRAVKVWASGIYYPRVHRSSLKSVLCKTASPDVLNAILH